MNSCSMPTVRACSATQSGRERKSTMADVPRGRGEPVGVEPGTGAGRIGEMAADGLHLAEAQPSQRLELAVEIAELAQAVELDREILGNVHAGHPIVRGAGRLGGEQ